LTRGRAIVTIAHIFCPGKLVKHNINEAILDEFRRVFRMAKAKMKSHRGASKRFRITGSGKVKRNKAYKSHILTKKSAKRKRGLRKPAILTSADHKRIKSVINL